MCPRKAWARTPPGRNWLSQGPRLTNGAVSSIGRIAQDAEGVGQRPDARYVVDGGMTARRFATRSSPSSDGGKGQALMFPSEWGHRCRNLCDRVAHRVGAVCWAARILCLSANGRWRRLETIDLITRRAFACLSIDSLGSAPLNST